MASTSIVYPTSITEIGPSANAWTNPSFAANAPNGSYAIMASLISDTTKHLTGNPAGLGLAIPAGATIDGIEVVVRGLAQLLL